ncbi:sugar phosphate isomerase/epimerase family protein [Umezawaea tangerina]|uniref:Sugar phosphate isomerase/epimerase n=1 Tax=Umezawaea tangerina TaxID=84725 RepID=A0A2T0TG67_9PSEU|nr:sugar phosphate isomerase/epimerase family protein [Umezawaea tangerina]PRY44676.1 sugar phosphate isomerase/epimerase [Umezawaea tangerina]
MNTLSLNQKTINGSTLAEAVSACVRAGITSIGVWREPLHDHGVQAGAALIADAGLHVSSLCRGGFFTAPDRTAVLVENRRAIEETAALGADCLVLVVGGLPPGSRDLPAARARVADVLADLVPCAADHGVRLALEPMNPLYCADRGVLSTLSQALDLAEEHDPAAVGVVVDTFHVWWDPDLETQIARAADRIASFQVCDWITPLPADALLARGVMGDGHIDFHHIADLVAKAGYTGAVEVEIFNADLWREDPDTVLATVVRRFAEHVLL